VEEPKKNNFKIVKFDSAIYLKETILDKKFVSSLENVKLKKYKDNHNNYFDGDKDQVRTALIGSYLQPHIHEIFKSDFALNRWWIQKYEKENFHDLHTHGNEMNFYSFILYLKATSKSSKTMFYGPGYPLVNWGRKEFQPKPGLFILFPSYIPHSAGYNKDTKRLILSGNIEII
jgi:hypothetical protein